jgi:hypothetical protein
MRDPRVRPLLWIIAISMAVLLVMFTLDPPHEERLPLPRNLRGLAERLLVHPTDWRAAGAVADHSLDSELPKRLEVWRSAHALAVTLAPHLEGPRTEYARAGLFHWYELAEADRREVLGALEPLLKDPRYFYATASPLFDLTGDLALLRRSRPPTFAATEWLRGLAVMNGRFADYRELRAEATLLRTREISLRLHSLPPSQLVASLPPNPTVDDGPLIAAALRALETRPLEVDCGRPDVLEAVIDFALRHRLRPLDGLAPTISEKSWASAYARANLARALGRNETADEIGLQSPRPRQGELRTLQGFVWDGFCGPDVCRTTNADVDGPLSITIQNERSDEVPPYVECYLDDALAWEGAITAPVTVALAPPGRHRVEIRLANPLTRNRESRRIRIS